MKKKGFLSSKKTMRNMISLGVAVLVVIILGLAVFQKISASPTFFGRARVDGLVVFVDAGHGGRDGGSSLDAEKRLEKDDNLKMALKVQDILNQKGVYVEMSRSTDEYVSLEDRCKMANKSQAQLFVSIHRNSAQDGNGVEIWAMSDKRKKDTALANCIMDKLDKAGISKNRGVRFGYISNSNGNYFVNENTDMPSCLIELGFITNSEDNELFDKNFEDYAKAIADGIIKAAGKLKLETPSESLV